MLCFYMWLDPHKEFKRWGDSELHAHVICLYPPFTVIPPVPSSSVVNDVSGPAPIPTSTVVNDVSGPTQNPPNNLPLIVGLVAGLVGLLVITLLMIIIVLSAVLVRQRKPAAITKQPFYDYVTPPQPPAQHESIQLKENEAYGKVLSDTSQPQVSIPSLQPNVAYGVIQTHQDLGDERDTPESQEYEIPLSSKQFVEGTTP